MAAIQISISWENNYTREQNERISQSSKNHITLLFVLLLVHIDWICKHSSIFLQVPFFFLIPLLLLYLIKRHRQIPPSKHFRVFLFLTYGFIAAYSDGYRREQTRKTICTDSYVGTYIATYQPWEYGLNFVIGSPSFTCFFNVLYNVLNNTPRSMSFAPSYWICFFGMHPQILCNVVQIKTGSCQCSRLGPTIPLLRSPDKRFHLSMLSQPSFC